MSYNEILAQKRGDIFDLREELRKSEINKGIWHNTYLAEFERVQELMLTVKNLREDNEQLTKDLAEAIEIAKIAVKAAEDANGIGH
jgi:hypothetical protein